MSNIFNLIENFIDIINNKCCLVMGAKYYNSSMNWCTYNLPSWYCRLPHKSHMADCILFKKENDFHVAFVLAISQPTQVSAHEVCLRYNI